MSTRFEDRLLTQLRAVVAEQPAAAPAPRRQRLTMRTLSLSGTAVAAATAAAIVVGTSGDRAPAAYAVSHASDGTVSVSIHSLDDAAGLQRELRAAGLPAVVDYRTEPGRPCTTAPGAGAKGPVTAAPPAGTAPGVAGAEAGTTESNDDSGPSFSTGGKQGDGDGPSTTAVGSVPGAAGVPADAPTLTAVARDADGVRFTIKPGNVKPGEKVQITTSSGSVDTIGISLAKPGQACVVDDPATGTP